MIVCENTKEVEGLGTFIQIFGRYSAKAVKTLAANVKKNPGKALETGAKNSTAAVSKKSKAASSTIPDVIDVFLSSRQRIISWKNCFSF